jgi:putative PIN family toxin of toxin-antitoxin system
VKVVVDTNVLVAGLLSPFGPPGEIVRMIASGTLRLCFDARILTEYSEVLARPRFQFSHEHTLALLEQIKAEGLSVAGSPLPARLPDHTDEPFLETAVAGKAECLITGNTKHFPSGRRQGMAVLSPRELLDHYRRRSQSRTRRDVT